jgi:hypothetical protein
MSVVKEDLGKASEVFANDLSTRPKLGLARFSYGIVETYTSAIWIAYGAAIGFRVEAATRRSDEDDRR